MWPFKGNHNTDVAFCENDFDSPVVCVQESETLINWNNKSLDLVGSIFASFKWDRTSALRKDRLREMR